MKALAWAVIGAWSVCEVLALVDVEHKRLPWTMTRIASAPVGYAMLALAVWVVW